MTSVPSPPPVIFIMGPTASGKTDLAVSLVERLPCELISVDSALVYRHMDIGTAKPEPEILARAPHRLINILDPSESYSAARFREDALVEIETIQARGNIPVLVGGTGLYFRALERGLSPLPEADPATRSSLEAEAVRIGWAAMHARLAELDPVAAQRIHPNDPQRLQRALEVYHVSGRSMTELMAQAQALPAFPYPLIKLVIAPSDRDYLRERIALRFHLMLEKGLIDEVERLYQRGDLHPDLPAIRCVGYRQVWSYLEGKWDYDTMVERGIIATRQLAKRQYTWLRSETATHWLDSLQGAEKVLTEGLKIITKGAIN